MAPVDEEFPTSSAPVAESALTAYTSSTLAADTTRFGVGPTRRGALAAAESISPSGPEAAAAGAAEEKAAASAGEWVMKPAAQWSMLVGQCIILYAA
jgi:hypothetical protein